MNSACLASTKAESLECPAPCRLFCRLACTQYPLARLGAAPGCGDVGYTRLDIPDCTGPSAGPDPWADIPDPWADMTDTSGQR